MKFNDYWNKTHEKYKYNKITYDTWLDKYLDIINNCKSPALDLGCGLGNDTLYLVEKGFRVVACDYSSVALEKLKSEINNVDLMLVDISEELPFASNSFDLIIADLSLHYFDNSTTIKIMYEIKRILKSNGHLLARVNSIKDINYGALQGEKLEDNFYYVEGYNKRFFNLEDVNKYFSIIGDIKANEATMHRYSKPKKVIEIQVNCKK